MIETSVGILGQTRSHACARLDDIIEQVSDSGCPAVKFREVRQALEALPLTTAEIATARNRLDNARNYGEAGERGAARYELRLLRRSLEQQRNDREGFTHSRSPMLTRATSSFRHAESVPVNEGDTQVPSDRKRRPERHRLQCGFPPAAATSRRDRGQPAEDVCFDPRAARGLLADVPRHRLRNPVVSGRGPWTFSHQRHHGRRAGEVVEHAVPQFDGRLARQRPLTGSRVAALDFGLELLAMLAKLGFAGFLSVGFVAAVGLTSGVNPVNPIAVPLFAGFFLWSLVVISCVTSRRA
jgi:hypothetical protein